MRVNSNDGLNAECSRKFDINWKGKRKGKKNLVIGPRVLNTDFTDLKSGPLCDSVSSFPLLHESMKVAASFNKLRYCKLERIAFSSSFNALLFEN